MNGQLGSMQTRQDKASIRTDHGEENFHIELPTVYAVVK